MGYILLACLAVELLIIYTFNGKNVVSPSFLACASFILATCIYLTGDKYYGYALHSNTVWVIVTLLFCIFLGEMVANRIAVKSAPQKPIAETDQKPILLRWSICILLAVVVLALSLIRFREVYKFSLTVGNPAGNIWTMAKYIRSAQLSGKATLNLSVVASQGTVISKCLTYLCIYCICVNKNRTGKFYWRCVLPILCYFPQIIASDNRTDMLNTMTVCVIIAFVLIKQRNGWTSKGNMKIVVTSLVLVFAFFAIFRWLGYRTETSLRSETWDNITEYTSAGLVGLDKYLQNGEAPNTLFGQWSLKGIYMILRQWGVPIPQVDRFEKFFTYAKGEANIYTGFKPYIKDYTMIGAGFAMFFWGAIISYGMKRIRKNGAGFVLLCWQGMLYYPVIMLSMDDTTSSVLGMSTLYTLFYLILLDLVFVKRKIRFRFGNMWST